MLSIQSYRISWRHLKKKPALKKFQNKKLLPTAMQRSMKLAKNWGTTFLNRLSLLTSLNVASLLESVSSAACSGISSELVSSSTVSFLMSSLCSKISLASSIAESITCSICNFINKKKNQSLCYEFKGRGDIKETIEEETSTEEIPE